MASALERFFAALGRPLPAWHRVALLVALVPLALSVTQPLWNIHMIAPQYPQGLSLDIYAYTIEGANEGRDLHEINILNHYIGMRKLERAEFTDLDWIPFAIGVLALLTLRVAALGDLRSLIDLAVLTAYFGLFSAGRFVFRLWVFGHDLDPKAPVRVDPFMPPVFGTQQIANFTASSFPRAGTFLITLFAAIILLLALWRIVSVMRGSEPEEGSAVPA
jgi:hypothetical protein